MASDITASSSSQQPFANPQPAPVPTSAIATSPPTKQSLKSWWKTFGKNTKSQDAHGKSSQLSQYSPRLSQRPCLSPRLRHDQSQQYPRDDLGLMYKGINFPRTIDHAGVRAAKFTEHPMSEATPIVDGVPDTSQALARVKDPRRTISHNAPAGHSSQRCHSSLLLQNPLRALRQQRSQSMLVRTPPALSSTIKRKKVQRGRRDSSLYIRDLDSGSSEALCAGILPHDKRNIFSRFLERLTRKSVIEPAAETTGPSEPQPAPGIFGVPLRQSITYANVAISLVDGEGKSYIYGYVPIVVAKCGVYLKEKGSLGPIRLELKS